MFHKQKGWFSSGTGKPPKNLHSLENLKYIYGLLSKNSVVTEQNKKLLVESLRSMAEILIWGDQNDTTVFDYFLEKNMLSFFMKYMNQPDSTYVCVQLLQTLNILFENIQHETSLYFLLSNNHINAIIKHKFNFADEEVMAYYISFLKSLSLKLNKHTIHFFYNEHTDDFALYSEAIKFFNHAENMVRIAVRTITLNVYRVREPTMQRYVHTKTALPYFSNLVWFIGNHVLQMDTCLRHDKDHNSKDRLSDLVAEHLNHLYYLNDMLCLNIGPLNEIISEQLLERLILPLYVYSLLNYDPYTPNRGDRPHLSISMALFLLSQVYLTIRDRHVIDTLTDFIFNCESSVFESINRVPIQANQTNRILRSFQEPEKLLTDCPILQSSLQVAKTSSDPAPPTGDIKASSSTSSAPPANAPTLIAPPTRRQRKKESKAELAISAKKSSSTSNGKKEATAAADNATSSGGSNRKSRRKTPKEEAKSTTKTDPTTIAAAADTPRDTEGRLNELAVNSDAYPASHDDGNSATTATEGAGVVGAGSTHTTCEDTPTRQRASSSSFYCVDSDEKDNVSTSSSYYDTNTGSVNCLDEEKLPSNKDNQFCISKKIYLNSIYDHLNCKKSDYHTLFALSVLHSIASSQGISQSLLESINISSSNVKGEMKYNVVLCDSIICVINQACLNDSRIRLATLELAIDLLLVLTGGTAVSAAPSCQDATWCCRLTDGHLACIEGAKESATRVLRTFYKVWEKSEEIFLDMFENELREIKNQKIDLEKLLQDSCLLLSVTGTPLTGIGFTKRWPCGEVERARRAISVFLQLRKLSLQLQNQKETHLPLTREGDIVKPGDVLNLNNRDLLACTLLKENKKERYFLVIDLLQLILVEPEMKKLGWGVVTFVGFLQDVEITGDKDDSRSLHVTVHRTPTTTSSSLSTSSWSRHASSRQVLPLLSAHFIFDDHIRCMAAKQRLTKGRLRARQSKMSMIAKLLELPSPVQDAIYQSRSANGVNPTLSSSSSTSLSNEHTSAATSANDSRGPIKRSTSVSQGQMTRSLRGPKMAGGAVAVRVKSCSSDNQAAQSTATNQAAQSTATNQAVQPTATVAVQSSESVKANPNADTKDTTTMNQNSAVSTLTSTLTTSPVGAETPSSAQHSSDLKSQPTPNNKSKKTFEEINLETI